MEYYDKAETLTRPELESLQAVRLRATVERASRSPFYAQRFKQAGIAARDMTSASSVAAIPFTVKEDLRSAYPFGLMTRPKEDFVRMHVSSGTTGTPTAVMHTRNDINWWASLMARCMFMVGMRPSDVFQNLSGYGLFTGGLGIHYGAERLGCLTIPAGAGNSARQLKIIQDFGTTAMHIIPSYALHLGQAASQMGFDPAALPPRIALIGAEPHSEEARKRIEEMWGLKAYNSYGLSEMNGPGVAFECAQQNGLHLWEDAYLAEIIDPDTLEPVPDGVDGELVLTTLCREGMPIIRYRTRDITRFLPGDCPCGRAHRRIGRITGRSDDMLIIKGVNIYPMQIEQILLGMPEVGGNYLIVLERSGPMDVIKVKVEVREEYFVEDMRALTALQKKIAGRLRDEILVTPKVELVEHNSLPKSEGKAKRVLDLREESA